MTWREGFGPPATSCLVIDPIGPDVRTPSMIMRTIDLDGLLDEAPLTLERLLEAAYVDRDDRLVIPLLDVLAMIHLDRAAEILLVEFDDGSTTAFTIRRLLATNDVALIVDSAVGTVTLAGPDLSELPVSDHPVGAMSAMTFAAFVGAG